MGQFARGAQQVLSCALVAGGVMWGFIALVGAWSHREQSEIQSTVMFPEAFGAWRALSLLQDSASYAPSRLT